MPRSPSPARGWLVLATFVLSAVATLRFLLPGDVPADVEPGAFSAERARRDVVALAGAPRPAGSTAHATARAWLVERLTAMGLEVDVEAVLAVSAWYGMPFDTGRVHDVVGRLRGRGPAGARAAVLLVAHYDTVVGSPGASDDAAGVAAALEVVRAVRAGPALEADLLILFTDLEEGGMVGAHAFVRDHPAARDVTAFINLDARGTSGPPVILGLSDPHGTLLAGIAHAGHAAATSSLYVEATRLLHGGTDFAVLAGSGLPGVNIAFADGVSRYHTGGDVAGALDPRTLQAEGALALALVRQWGRGSSEQPAPRLHEVYFGLPAIGVVTLPAWMVRGSVVPLVVLAAAVVFRRRRELSVRGVALHAATTIAVALAAGLVAWAAWRGLAWAHPVHAAMRAGDPHDVGLLRIAAAVWGFAALLGGRTILARRGHRDAEQSAGALAIGVVGAALLALLAPAAGYAVIAPVLVALVARLPRRPPSRLAAAMFAAAALALFGTPIVYTVLVALELPGAGLAVAIVVLLASWVPGSSDVPPRARPWIALGGVAIAVALVVVSSVAARFDAEHPRPTCLTYRLDDTSGEASWRTDERAPAPSTRRFVPTLDVRAPDAPLAPWAGPAFAAPAPRLSLPAPEIEVLAETTGAGSRSISLRLRSRRKAAWLYVTTDARVLAARIADGDVSLALPTSTDGREEPWSFRHVGPDEDGLLLELVVAGAGRITLHVTDQSFELPAPADGPREAHTAACRSWWADSTLVGTSSVL
jgi:hypothetical protein